MDKTERLFICFQVKDALKEKLDRRLGRNLLQKVSKGPLDRKKAKSQSMRLKGHRHVKKRRSSADSSHHHHKQEQLHHLGESDYFVGNSAVQSVRPLSLSRREQEQRNELREIEEMGIVRGHQSKQVRNHIRNHVSHRMFNHRLMIKPDSSERSRKSSVLVTSVNDEEEEARKLFRQQSRVVIEGLFQLPSHDQRVLERLSDEQISDIKSKEMAKLKKHSKKSLGSIKVCVYLQTHSALDQTYLLKFHPEEIGHFHMTFM